MIHPTVGACRLRTTVTRVGNGDGTLQQNFILTFDNALERERTKKSLKSFMRERRREERERERKIFKP